jgi:hypothetical protein
LGGKIFAPLSVGMHRFSLICAAVYIDEHQHSNFRLPLELETFPNAHKKFSTPLCLLNNCLAPGRTFYLLQQRKASAL